jgi:hypothetical protein
MQKCAEQLPGLAMQVAPIERHFALQPEAIVSITEVAQTTGGEIVDAQGDFGDAEFKPPDKAVLPSVKPSEKLPQLPLVLSLLMTGEFAIDRLRRFRFKLVFETASITG